MKERLRSKCGETLMEVVLSVGLFSLTMLLAVSMFFTANRVTQKDYETGQKLDKLINAAVMRQYHGSGQTQEVTFLLTDLSGGTRTVKANVIREETKEPDTGSLYQFDR